MKKIIAITLIAIMVLVGCTKPTVDPSKPAIILSVQNSCVALGEENAFVADIKNIDAEITYQVCNEGGEYETYLTTFAQTVAYRCEQIGEYSVRALVTDGDETVVSNEVKFSVVDAGGETFGTSPNLEIPSINVDLSYDFGEYAYIEHKAVRNITEETAYFKGICADQFVVRTKVDIIVENYDDQYAKSGIFIRCGKERHYIAFDYRPDFMNKEIVYVKYDGNDWLWSEGIVWQTPNCSFREGNTRIYNELMIVRDKETIYVAVNGEWIGRIVLNGFTEPTTVGTMTMSQNTVFFEYSCYLADTEEYQNALSIAQSMTE